MKFASLKWLELSKYTPIVSFWFWAKNTFWADQNKQPISWNKFRIHKFRIGCLIWWTSYLACNCGLKRSKFCLSVSTRTTDAQWNLFSLKSQKFVLGQIILADKFWGIWGIFGRFISTHFGTMSPLSMFFINQPLFLLKKP